MIGIVISTDEGPSTENVDFVLIKDIPVHQGQYVVIDHPAGKLVALVTEVKRGNRYFEHTEAVKEYSKNMETTLPVDLWSYTVVKTKPLLIWDGKRRYRPTYPPPPGSHVDIPDPSLISDILDFSEDGLFLGKVQHHDVEARLDLSKTLQKHLAILAMSGAGKSYLTSVLIEELLDRKRDSGRIAVVVFDVHGEYVGFSYPDSPYSDRAEVFKGDKIKISLKHLGASGIADMVSLTDVQLRELDKLSFEGDLQDLVKEVERKVSHDKTRKSLLSNIYRLQKMEMISSVEDPAVKTILKPGRLVVFDLSPLIDLRKKRLVVYYYLKRMFELRRKGEIPPTLVIIEEAHQFAPEQASSTDAFSKTIIDTVAREGRKFGLSLCLISQRPIKLSTTALSQCNTHIILRITNPNDLDHIKESSEALDKRSVSLITTLTPGEALIVGAATYFPVFIRVRERKSPEVYEKNLKEMALEWERSHSEQKNISKQL